MTNDEFRIYHANIIEQYQFIEHDLEGIFGLLEKGDFEELTRRVENDTMGELIRKVRFLCKEYNISYLSKDDFNMLEHIRNDRNFWCHECYLDIFKNNELFDDISIRLKNDYRTAYSMNKKLRETFKTLNK